MRGEIIGRIEVQSKLIQYEVSGTDKKCQAEVGLESGLYRTSHIRCEAAVTDRAISEVILELVEFIFGVSLPRCEHA